MVWMAFLFPSYYGVLPVVTMMGTARQIPAFHRWNLEYLKPCHWQWGPDPFNDKLWESWMYGGPVPWSEWMPALLFHTARLIPYYLMFALVFYPVLVTFRGELFNGIKALFGKAPPEFEAREPMKYRYLLLCYVVLLLIFVASWYYASLGNLPILYGVFWYIVDGLFYMGRARVAAEFGCVTDVVLYGHTYYHNWTALRVWWVADPGSPFYIRNPETRYLVLAPEYEWSATFIIAAPMATLLESYKVASIEGVHSRYIFVGMIIAVVLGVVVSLFALLQMWCSFGALNLAAFNYTGVPNNYQQRGATYPCRAEVGDYWRTGLGHHPEPLHWVLFIVGASIVSVIYALHARFPWFPVNPGGVALGAFDLVPNIVLIPAIVAYAAKFIILRIGGTRIYEDVAMPFAIGMVAGSTGITVLFAFLHNLSTTLAIL